MAGAGYKLFNTGDVLLASEVNTYLMQQTVMSFADSAARTTALSGVLAEGMVSYLRDTNVVEIYNGSAWASLDDPNAIQNTIVDAKGDIVTASASDTPARLAVGNNGETLVADSSQTTGLAYREDYAAGKNKIINGDFNINQRAFTSNTTSGLFNFDRWTQVNSGGTTTVTPQTFTPGSAPVAGYEGKTFLQINVTGQSANSDRALVNQKIESVRTFAGQTVTISFWAKASSSTPSVALELAQDFGSGGSPSATVNIPIGKQAITTSFARYTATVSVPSISGKTLGTAGDNLNFIIWLSAGSDFNTRASTLGTQTNTFSIWGVQVEDGSVATAFQTATGTLQGELAACQRYYWRGSNTQTFARYGNGAFSSSTLGVVIVAHPVTMRIAPTSIDFSSLLLYDFGTDLAVTNLTLTTNCQSSIVSLVSATIASGGTQYRPIQLTNNNNASAYVGFSAEL